MKSVLDSDVVVAALRSDAGASHRLLAGALRRRFTLLLSVPLVLEYRAVLSRPEQLAATGLTMTETERFLDGLAAVAKPVHLSFLWRPQLKDPDDEMVLETAINGAADLLVTFNRRDFGQAGMWFGLRIVTPAAALGELEL